MTEARWKQIQEWAIGRPERWNDGPTSMEGHQMVMEILEHRAMLEKQTTPSPLSLLKERLRESQRNTREDMDAQDDLTRAHLSGRLQMAQCVQGWVEKLEQEGGDDELQRLRRRAEKADFYEKALNDALRGHFIDRGLVFMRTSHGEESRWAAGSTPELAEYLRGLTHNQEGANGI